MPHSFLSEGISPCSTNVSGIAIVRMSYGASLNSFENPSPNPPRCTLSSTVTTSLDLRSAHVESSGLITAAFMIPASMPFSLRISAASMHSSSIAPAAMIVTSFPSLITELLPLNFLRRRCLHSLDPLGYLMATGPSMSTANSSISASW